jgi:hypothetical protein
MGGEYGNMVGWDANIGDQRSGRQAAEYLEIFTVDHSMSLNGLPLIYWVISREKV